MPVSTTARHITSSPMSIWSDDGLDGIDYETHVHELTVLSLVPIVLIRGAGKIKRDNESVSSLTGRLSPQPLSFGSPLYSQRYTSISTLSFNGGSSNNHPPYSNHIGKLVLCLQAFNRNEVRSQMRDHQSGKTKTVTCFLIPLSKSVMRG